MARTNEGKPAPRRFVVWLTDREKLGAPLRLAPDPDLPPSRARQTTTRLKYAARFATKAAARKFLKSCEHPGYACTVGEFSEEDLPRPRAASKDCQPLLPIFEG